MYCINCGREIDDDMLFCPACGAKQRTVEEQQTSAPPSEEKPDELNQAEIPEIEDDHVDDNPSEVSGEPDTAKNKKIRKIIEIGSIVVIACAVIALIIYSRIGIAKGSLAAGYKLGIINQEQYVNAYYNVAVLSQYEIPDSDTVTFEFDENGIRASGKKELIYLLDSYFGDLNNDGYKDIMVTYAGYKSPTKRGYFWLSDSGVKCYLSKPDGTLNDPVRIRGGLGSDVPCYNHMFSELGDVKESTTSDIILTDDIGELFQAEISSSEYSVNLILDSFKKLNRISSDKNHSDAYNSESYISADVGIYYWRPDDSDTVTKVTYDFDDEKIEEAITLYDWKPGDSMMIDEEYRTEDDAVKEINDRLKEKGFSQIKTYAYSENTPAVDAISLGNTEIVHRVDIVERKEILSEDKEAQTGSGIYTYIIKRYR